MRLVPANEQSVGRIGTAQKPKPSKADFLLEVSQQTGRHPDSAANNKQKLIVSSAISAASKSGEEAKVDPSLSTSEEDEGYQVDEQSLAEGVNLFGSLFTLLEEHLSAGLGELQKFEDGKDSLMAGVMNSDSSDRKLAQPNTGNEAIVIDLAEMRHRSAGSAKIRDVAEVHNSLNAVGVASNVASLSNVIDENQNVKMAGKIQPRLDIKPTSFMRSDDNIFGLPSAHDSLADELIGVEQSLPLGMVPRAKPGQNQLRAAQTNSEMRPVGHKVSIPAADQAPMDELVGVEQSPPLGMVPRAKPGQNQLRPAQTSSELMTRSQVGDESRTIAHDKYSAETQTAARLRATPKDESSKADVRHSDALPVKSFSPEVSPQPNLVPESRVDQIVRAVVEQAQQPLVARSTINTHELNTNLNGNTLRMNLHPEELGGLHIAVSKRGKRLEVNVSSEIAGTGRLLLEDAAALAQKLSATDSEVEHVQVRIQTTDGSVDIHELGDVLQFDVRPNGNQSSSEQKSPRSRSDRGQQIQKGHEGERWVEEQYPSIDGHRRTGAVYI